VQSAYIGQQQVETCKRHGIDHILPKPVDPDLLKKILTDNEIIDLQMILTDNSFAC
jgi:CheY-like chemotaxis protein